MAVRAKTNLEKCGLAHLVEIRIGDAIDLMAFPWMILSTSSSWILTKNPMLVLCPTASVS